MTDLVVRLRERADDLSLDAAAEIVRLRLRLSDMETSIAAFRQTVNEWEW